MSKEYWVMNPDETSVFISFDRRGEAEEWIRDHERFVESEDSYLYGAHIVEQDLNDRYFIWFTMMAGNSAGFVDRNKELLTTDIRDARIFDGKGADAFIESHEYKSCLKKVHKPSAVELVKETILIDDLIKLERSQAIR